MPSIERKRAMKRCTHSCDIAPLMRDAVRLECVTCSSAGNLNRAHSIILVIGTKILKANGNE